MATPDNSRNRMEDRNLSSGRGEDHSTVPNDLPDSPQDQEKLKPEETVINLPDVSDIPGQENVTVPRMESFVDTTISSDDEEGTGIFGDDADYNDTTARTSMGQDENTEGNVVEGTP